MKRIFISHASKDKEIVQAFMDEILIGALGIKITDIFCTTTDGTKIKSGNDWRNDIQEHLVDSKVTFLIITPNYKESEICLNEMGAAWVLSGKTIPLIVEPVNYESVGLLQVVKQVEKIQDIKSLDRVRDVLQENLEIPANEIPSDRWTDQKEKFLSKVSTHLKANPFKSPFTRDQFESLIKQVDFFSKENETLKQTEKSLNEKNSKLINLNEDLKAALGSKESMLIENKYFDMQSMEEFKLLCEKTKKALSKAKGIILGMIFVDYSGKKIYLNFEGWDSIIQDALARNVIYEGEFSFDVNWDNPTMKHIQSSIRDLEKFIDKNDVNKEFLTVYESEFEAPLDLSNLDFWEEVLEKSVPFK